jgi:FkbM family methyltransferase
MKRVHDPDFTFFANFKDLRGGHFIDVGANCGQSALSFAAVQRGLPIVSFEPNASVERFLQLARRLIGTRFNFHLFGIGERDEEMTFFVPRLNRVLLSAEGTFVRDELLEDVTIRRLGGVPEIVTYKFAVRNFDNLNRLGEYQPAFVKIDTQGYELSVLKSMKLTFNKYSPILLIEKASNPDQRIAIGEFLDSMGYEVAFYDDSRNTLSRLRPTRSSNFFALPSLNRLPSGIREIVERCLV